MRHGFLLVDKPKGPTSHDIVDAVRSTLCEGSVGHLGTLDPLASGLLVLAVGKKALKVIELFADLRKEYVADLLFGAVSSTYDSTGVIEHVEPKVGWTPPDAVQLREIIAQRFLGKIHQRPPQHSAVHVQGKRAYELARKGIPVTLPLREIVVDACEIIAYDYPHAKLRIACSAGTYIRSLIHDLGCGIRSNAYMTDLRRTRVGEWSVEDAVRPEDATWSRVMPLKEVLLPFPRTDLTHEQFLAVQQGKTVDVKLTDMSIGWHDDLPVAILIPSTKQPGMRPRKVL